MQSFSSPNRIVWEYFWSLRLLVQQSREAPSPELARQAAALAVVMAVTVGEVFLNLWFRIRVEGGGSDEQRKLLRKDLTSRMSLEKKLRQWPLRFIGVPLNLDAGAGAEFAAMKSLRNSIVHFTTSHETVDLGDAVIQGLADTSDYDRLDAATAARALRAAEGLVAEVFKLAGTPQERVPHALHAWTGRVGASP